MSPRRWSARGSYLGDYLRASTRPTATYREARMWYQQTSLDASTAAALADKGYTPDVVLSRLAAAPVRWEDERDEEAAIDAMLYGPDLDAS